MPMTRRAAFKISPSIVSAFYLMAPFWFVTFLLYFIDTFSLFRAADPVAVSAGAWRIFLKLMEGSLPSIVEILMLSGLWGIFLGILTGDDQTPRMKSFNTGVKKYFLLSLLVTLVPWLVHFVLFVAYNKQFVPIALIKAVMAVPVIYFFTGFIFRMEYQKRLRKPAKDLPISSEFLVWGLVFFLLPLVLFFLGEITLNDRFLHPLVKLLSFQVYFLAMAFFFSAFFLAFPDIKKKSTLPRKLILVMPAWGGIMPSFVANILRPYPPFFTVLRALMPPGYEVFEYNFTFWKENYYQSDALVAISCFTFNSAEAYKIAKEFRKRGSKVIMGGPHVSFFPEEALEFCDSVVIGAAESVWEEVVGDFEKDQLKSTYRGTCTEEQMARVHHYIMGQPTEESYFFLQAQRGCKFKCYFCANAGFSANFIRPRPIEDVVDLVRRLKKNGKGILFLDNNIYVSPQYAKDLFKALAPLKVRWNCAASLDIAEDEEALQLLKKAGCYEVLVGYEVDPASKETGLGDKFSMTKDYMTLSKRLKKAGIGIKAHFIFGFPGDSWKTLLRTWWFCLRMSPKYTVLSFMTPLPGSQFFKDAVRDEKLIDLNWRNFNIQTQVWDHQILKYPVILRTIFPAIAAMFFLTTSTLGRYILFFCGLLFFVSYYYFR